MVAAPEDNVLGHLTCAGDSRAGGEAAASAPGRAPRLVTDVFPPESLGVLKLFSQIGVCLGLVVAVVGLMLWFVRPRLPRWLGVNAASGGTPGPTALTAVLIVLLSSALATELLGIHALFGAFFAGVVVPAQPEFREYLTVRLEKCSSLFLLPLFFAFSGLRTQVGLLNDTASWLVCLAIIGVATVGKLGGTALTARLTGMTRNDACALGALMNTRGLVELVALNIGCDLGILPPRIFAMLVLMALVTTFMTGPLLNLADRAKRCPTPAVVVAP